MVMHENGAIPVIPAMMNTMAFMTRQRTLLELIMPVCGGRHVSAVKKRQHLFDSYI